MDRFMKLAFILAKKADPYPNPRVGAVLVKNVRGAGGKTEAAVLGAGYHKGPGMPHAEIEAIEDAKRKTRNPDAARGAILYVSLEPCSHTAKRTPPCTKAIIESGIAKVVFAMKDPNPLVRGASVLRKSGISVEGPTDEKEGKALDKRYISNISKKPFIAIKMAMSADGKTATRTNDSKWISCEKSRDLVHEMRAGSDAVMVGAGTIRSDDPSLTSHGKGDDPYRIIVDGALGIPMDAHVLENKDRKTIIATCEGADKRKLARISRKAMVLQAGRSSVDMVALFHSLSAMGMKKILIEGGSGLNASALESGMVDRIYLFIAPKIIGGVDAKGVIGGIGAAKVSGSIKIRRMDVKKVGEDILLTCDISRPRT
jgi:diaminohydroxyphosphoribosylaminopyrimidine deaminase/5-amino-6-(5-phosphoribosylamino)uracil reductase